MILFGSANRSIPHARTYTPTPTHIHTYTHTHTHTQDSALKGCLPLEMRNVRIDLHSLESQNFVRGEKANDKYVHTLCKYMHTYIFGIHNYVLVCY